MRVVRSNETEKALSYAQKALWFIHKMDPQCAAYNVSFYLQSKGGCRPELLKNAFAGVTAKNPILRSVYLEKSNGEPYRVVQNGDGFTFDVTQTSSDFASLNDELYKQSQVPFDLEKGPLLRVKVYQHKSGGSTVHVCIHHINMDGVTSVLLFDQLKTFYSALESGKSLDSEDTIDHYADFVNWQRQYVSGADGVAALSYWKEKLSGELPNLNLPFDKPRPAVQNYNGDTVRTKFDAKTTKAIRDLAKSKGVTPYVLFLSLYNVLLHFYTRQDDLIVGSPFSGRPTEEFETALGYFVNMVTVRTEVKGEQSIDELMEKINLTTLDNLENGNYPFPLLVEKLRIPRDSSRSPVFQTVFAYQILNYDLGESGSETDFVIDPSLVDQQDGQFDLFLEIYDQKETLLSCFRYSTDLFERSTIEQMVESFSAIVDYVLAHPNSKIGDIEAVSKSQRDLLLKEFNSTARNYSLNTTVVELFEDCVRKFPNRKAVVCMGQSITYQELDKRASQLAGFLHASGVKKNEPVAILAEPSLETMLGILGALKAGCPYLPIDSGLPAGRIEYILKDSGARFLLRHTSQTTDLDFNGLIIDLKNKVEAKAELPRLERNPSDLAYIIYTSGTTGNPKGAMLEHRSLVNYVSYFRDDYKINESHVSALLTSYAFDLGYTTLWTTILLGGELHMLPETIYKDIYALLSYIREKGVNFIKLTPSLFSAIISAPDFKREDFCKGLKVIVTGGEKPRIDDLKTYFDKYPDVFMMNHYGPTETTIGICTKPISPTTLVDFAKKPVVGKPIGNVKLYVVNPYMKLLPVGVPGELLASGACLARGYLGREELNAEKFITNPFDSSTRCYRTGDLARWTSEGTVEFLGRIDRQVKIRGYRVELGEIEKQVLQMEGVSAAAVIDRTASENNRYLCAYYVANRKVDAKEFKEKMSKVLPDYMVPSYFVQLKALPVTANGKLDMRALPEPEMDSGVGSVEAPKTDLEKTVAELWARLLGTELDKIGTNQNFFEIGGHSLLVIQMISELRGLFGCSIPIAAVYNGGTIKTLVELIEKDKANAG